MIQGIGNDIIEVERIAQTIAKHGERFLDRLFTQTEQRYCQRHRHSARHFAGRFAAKEAIAKALGTGFRQGLSWLDITIVSDALGKPLALLSDSVKEHFDDPTVWVSISHCHHYAAAVAIWEGVTPLTATLRRVQGSTERKARSR